MMAIVLATAIANMLTRDTIYTLKLRRRGIEIDQERSPSPMRLLTVRDAMQSLPAPVSQELRLGEVIARFAEQGRDALPVVDGAGRYRGTVTSRRVEQALREDGAVALGDLAESVPTLSPGMRPSRTPWPCSCGAPGRDCLSSIPTARGSSAGSLITTCFAPTTSGMKRNRAPARPRRHAPT